MKKDERKLPAEDEAYLGPVAVAVFIDMGWFRYWPLTYTRAALKAKANGYGRDRLPIAVEHKPDGAYFWEGRRA